MTSSQKSTAASDERNAEFEAKIPKRPESTEEINEERVKLEVVEELNQKHAAIHTDQFYILTEKHNSALGHPDFTLESKQSFLNCYENQIIQIDEKTWLSKAQIWLKHPKRRFYDGITFDPKTTEHKGGQYNIWKGFAVDPKLGNCQKFKELLLNVICQRNSEYYEYVWKWCARLVQKPDEPGLTGLVLMGKQGTGKGTFAKDGLGSLFGPHFSHLSDLGSLVGNFNYHLKNSVLIYADEAIWGGNKRDIGRLKTMVTEPTAMIEPKGKDAITVKNFRHLILASNEIWPVHLDPDDRRFLILKITDKHKEDIPYFKAILDELENGGRAALLYELLHEDISGFDPRHLPQNTEAFSVKLLSAPSTEKYIYEALCMGCFDVGNATSSSHWQTSISTETVRSDYATWCFKQGFRQESTERLGAALHKLISADKRRPRDGEVRQYKYFLPDLQEARSRFEKEYKAGSSIWDK